MNPSYHFKLKAMPKGIFDCMDYSKLWTILKEMGIPDHLTCLLRKLYADQEATVRTGQKTTVEWTGSKLEREYIKAV